MCNECLYSKRVNRSVNVRLKGYYSLKSASIGAFILANKTSKLILSSYQINPMGFWGFGMVLVCFWYVFGYVFGDVFWYGFGTVWVWFWYGFGMVLVWFWLCFW